MYYYMYKITNTKEDSFYYGYEYIGIRSCRCLPEKDRYWGGGPKLKKDQRKIATETKKNFREFFTKEILQFFDNENDLLKAEKDYVTEEYLKNKKTYNQILGGGEFPFKQKTTGKLSVRDKDGNIFHVSVNDPRYLSGELVHTSKGKFQAKDKDGNTYYISNDDPRYLSGELVGMRSGSKISEKHKSVFKNKITAKDKDGNTYYISNDDPRYLSGELVHFFTGRINVKDKEGNILSVFKDDPRWLSGELISVKKDTIIVKDKNGKCFKVSRNDPRWLSGELVGQAKGTIPVRDKNGKCFKVSRNDPRWLSGEVIHVSRKLKNDK